MERGRSIAYGKRLAALITMQKISTPCNLLLLEKKKTFSQKFTFLEVSPDFISNSTLQRGERCFALQSGHPYSLFEVSSTPLNIFLFWVFRPYDRVTMSVCPSVRLSVCLRNCVQVFFRPFIVPDIISVPRPSLGPSLPPSHLGTWKLGISDTR